jgi:HSP20 family protein
MANTNPLQPASNILIEQMRDQMRRMLVRLEEMRVLASQASGAWTPPVDVLELEDAILVKLEMPGVTHDHLRISLIDNTIKIEGRKERNSPTGNLPSDNDRPIRFICLERTYGSFAFTVTLKWQVDSARVSARMSDGVLEIHLPKTETAGREITVPITE